MRIILVLSVVGAGAYIGNESPALEYSHYFWDLTGYVVALQSEFPYRTTETFTFLYPLVAADRAVARRHSARPPRLIALLLRSRPRLVRGRAFRVAVAGRRLAAATCSTRRILAVTAATTVAAAVVHSRIV